MSLPSLTATASTASPATIVASGSGGGTTEAAFPPLLNLASADLAVTGKTAKLQIRAAALTNEVKPLLSFTVGLYPITVSGGENGLVLTTGTVVTGSTVAISEPPASSITRGVTAADFSLPSDGLYALAFVQSAKLTAKNATMVVAQLQMRNT